MPRATRTFSVNTSGKEDHENSVEDWGRQTKESLVLKCNGCGLDAKGNKLSLQTRLFNQFCTVRANIHPNSQANEGISHTGADAGEDITLVLAKL